MYMYLTKVHGCTQHGCELGTYMYHAAWGFYGWLMKDLHLARNHVMLDGWPRATCPIAFAQRDSVGSRRLLAKR